MKYSAQSPKNKFRIQFNYAKPIKEIGSVVSYTTNTIEDIVRSTQFVDRAKRAKDGAIATVYENKAQYPEFDWVVVDEIFV